MTETFKEFKVRLKVVETQHCLFNTFTVIESKVIMFFNFFSRFLARLQSPTWRATCHQLLKAHTV